LQLGYLELIHLHQTNNLVVVFLWAISLCYFLLFFVFCWGWYKQNSFKLRSDAFPHTFVSVVIAARNEAKNIQKCLLSIQAQNYPQHLFEIIVFDDCSTDQTVQVIRDLNIPNLKLILGANLINEKGLNISFKKVALSNAINASNGDLIVTTDADCWMGENWLKTIASFYESERVEMIVAPVRFSTNRSLLQVFQSLDFLTMQGITVAVVRLNLGLMCNGANLAFSRKSYDLVNGYQGIDHIISGDDYLLQMKIKNKFPNGVKYLKNQDVIVSTLPQNTWYDFIQQRIRWASKSGRYKDDKMTIILVMVYLFNLSLLLLGLSSLFFVQNLYTFLVFLGIKILLEMFFIIPVLFFFSRSIQLIIFPFLQPFHMFYIVLAGFLSRIGKFEWKDRKVNQS
jgi:cellulose synthase/poly-beta-1,6-N-acetylglucosamine synthase-like glycosyltransferase